MDSYSFLSAYSQARELYGVEVNPDEFETIGMIAWDKIGNKKYRWYKFTATPTETDSGAYFIELPCNVDIIEAVTADYEDYQKTGPMMVSGRTNNGWIEGYIENRKFNTNFLYPPGKFIKYHQEGNTLFLADNFDTVNVLYKGVLADEDGLPEITTKEMDAIAVFVAYTKTYKDAIRTRDQLLLAIAKDLEAKWKNLCTQARVASYINQNEMDEILNVATSWDRKRFGKSFKPIR